MIKKAFFEHAIRFAALLLIAASPASVQGEQATDLRLLVQDESGMLTAVDPDTLADRTSSRASLPRPLPQDATQTAVAADGSSWQGDGVDLQLVSASGQVLARADVLGSLRALSQDAAEGVLWSLEGRNLVSRDVVTGEELSRARVDLDGALAQLAVSPRGGPIWVASDGELLLLRPGDDPRKLEMPLRVDDVVADGYGGAWALAEGTLVRLLATGEWFVFPLPEQYQTHWVDLAVRSSTLWMTDGSLLVRFDVDRGGFRDRAFGRRVISLRLSIEDSSPPVIQWQLPAERPEPGATVFFSVEVDEAGSGLADEGVEVAVNGRPRTDSCQEIREGQYACSAQGAYQAGQFTLVVSAIDRAGNVSNRLRTLWTAEPELPQRFGMVEALLPAVADSHLRVGLPNQNFGSEEAMRVRWAGINRPVVRFDLASVADDIDVLESATLELSIVENGDNWGTGKLVDVHRLTAPWEESSVTWLCSDDSDLENSLPDCSPLWWGGDIVETPTDSVLHINGQSGTVTFDVTADVQLFLDGQASDSGWLVKRWIDGTGWVEYATREHPTGSLPELRLVYQPNEPADETPPAVSFLAPQDGTLLAVNQPPIQLTYSDDSSGVDPGTLAISVNSVLVQTTCTATSTSASCQLLEALPEGAVMLSASVSDNAGNTSAASVSVTVDTLPPDPVDIALVTANVPDGGTSLVEGSASAAEPATQLTVTNQAGGGSVQTTVAADGSFSVSLPAASDDILGMILTDAAGNSSAESTIVVPSDGSGDDPPPDPSTVADPLDPTVATDFFVATEFLWTGADPIQTGVLPGTIEPRRVAVLRGRVLDNADQPLPSVQISVVDHPEFGATRSRLDGVFDLAVNGGSYLTLRYEKDGHMEVQRRVETPWRDYRWIDDVVLRPLDTAVTQVASSSPDLQVARGSQVQDEDGIRQATMLFKAGTGASAVLSGGTSQNLDTLSVRATEYTVGANGPASMPAALPVASAYTYAVELSVDEAQAMGAKRVEFDQPVSFYVENFLEFPAGSIVPVGYYDREVAAWLASDNGLVIDILSVSSGLADLDLDGSGTPADATALAALGIDDAERESLASLYQPGDSLWRVPVSHFTPYDCNWPFAPPDGAEEPPDPDDEDDNDADADDSDPEDNNDDAEDEDDPCETDGSIVECENQNLRESLKIPGSPYTLNYSTARVAGRQVARTAKIRLTGVTVPSELKRVELEIDIAGQQHRLTFSPAPDQSHTFVWDGLDAYGRSIRGLRTALIRVGFVYDLVYSESPDDFQRAWGRYSDTNGPATDRQRGEVTLWRETTRNLKGVALEHSVVGGWTFDVHHSFDPGSSRLLLGDGTVVGTGQRAHTIREWAGSDFGGFSGDGGPATEARLMAPTGLDVGADGSLYIADELNRRVRRVSPIGIIETVAGDGTSGSGGDGGPATSAQLEAPTDVAVAADGTFYITDIGCECIRKVAPSGVISTLLTDIRSFGIDLGPEGDLFIADNSHQVLKLSPDGQLTVVAGTGVSGTLGDGGPAVQAQIRAPFDVAVDSQGRLYINTYLSGRIRVVTPDGIIQWFAGNGLTTGASGDGGPARQAAIGQARSMAIGPDDSLYVAQFLEKRVRRIRPDGLITSVAVGIGGSFEDRDPSTATAFFTLRGVAATPDGHLFISDTGDDRVGRVRPALPGSTVESFSVPSRTGSELYFFDSLGRHLETRHSLTGALLYTFEYDGNGQLTTVTDGDGLATSIELDTAGLPQAILGPYGHRTDVTLDSGGFLSSASMPGSVEHFFSYSPGGLLETATNPRGHETTYGYSTMGRLVTTQDAAGGTKQLSRRTAGDDYQVTLTSRAGAETRYRVTQQDDGSVRRSLIAPAGHTTETLTQSSGTTTTSSPDGTVVAEVRGPDPRFGMQAPLTDSLSVTLPSGLTQLATISRTAQLQDSSDPLSIETVNEVFAINGRTYTSDYDVATSQLTVASPEGRQAVVRFDSQGRATELSHGGIEPVHLEYDTDGRIAFMRQGTGAEERVTSSSYDLLGRLTTLAGPGQRTTTFDYDIADRITRQTLPGLRVVDYQKDERGNTTSLTPPGRPAHGFTYTPVDLPDTHTAPDAGQGASATSWAFDLDRLPRTLTRPSGETVEWVYAPSTRRLERIETANGDYTLTYTPGTDQLREVSHWPQGSGNGTPQTAAYTYDGFLPRTTVWSGEVSGSVEHTYNSDFRVASQLVNGGGEILFSYDDDSLLTQVGALTVTRSPSTGFVAGTTLESVTTASSYNSFGEIETFSAADSNSTLFNVTYVRDQLGRVEAKTETVGGLTSNYDYIYDPSGRLTEVRIDGALVESYGYGANSNRLTYDGTYGPATGSYDSQDRLTSYGGLDYVFDVNGDLVSKGTGTASVVYDYDSMGSLRTVVLDTGITIEYLVDGHGRRVGKKVAGLLVEALLYQDKLNPVALIDDQGSLTRFVYGTRAHVPDYMERAGATYRIVTDHLGSVRLVVDATTGTIVQQIDYDSFGRVMFDSAPGFQPFGFAGGLYDHQTGLVRFGARDYDPVTGRWTAADPFLFGGADPNRYLYSGGDPVNLIDSEGRSATAAVGGWIAGDVLIPEPTDLAWPKWVGYGIADGGAAIIDWLILDWLFDNPVPNDPIPYVGPEDKPVQPGKDRPRPGEKYRYPPMPQPRPGCIDDPKSPPVPWPEIPGPGWNNPGGPDPPDPVPPPVPGG